MGRLYLGAELRNGDGRIMCNLPRREPRGQERHTLGDLWSLLLLPVHLQGASCRRETLSLTSNLINVAVGKDS